MSEHGVLCTFWLGNALRATGPCNFFDIWTSKSGPVLVCLVHFDLEMYFTPPRCAIAHLGRWLCTRRFREPTFRPSRPTNHSKNTVFRDFPNISRTCIFFLLTLSLSLFYSSLLCFSSLHIVGSLTSKLPLILASTQGKHLPHFEDSAGSHF